MPEQNKYITNMILHDHGATYVYFVMAANQKLVYIKFLDDAHSCYVVHLKVKLKNSNIRFKIHKVTNQNLNKNTN